MFHLHIASASHKPNVTLNGQCLKHDPRPVYLGVTLDRTLTYKKHLQKTAGKLKTRKILLMKLAESSWDAHVELIFVIYLFLSQYSVFTTT